MPAHFEKTNTPDVVRIMMTDPLQTPEILDAIYSTLQYAEGLPGKVYVILDCSKVRALGLPSGAMQVGTTPLIQDSDKYYVLAIGVNVIGQTIGEALMRVMRQKHIRYVKTNDDAQQLITQLRSES
jgi:hypothetical protein